MIISGNLEYHIQNAICLINDKIGYLSTPNCTQSQPNIELTFVDSGDFSESITHIFADGTETICCTKAGKWYKIQSHEQTIEMIEIFLSVPIETEHEDSIELGLEDPLNSKTITHIVPSGDTYFVLDNTGTIFTRLKNDKKASCSIDGSNIKQILHGSLLDHQTQRGLEVLALGKDNTLWVWKKQLFFRQQFPKDIAIDSLYFNNCGGFLLSNDRTVYKIINNSRLIPLYFDVIEVRYSTDLLFIFRQDKKLFIYGYMPSWFDQDSGNYPEVCGILEHKNFVSIAMNGAILEDDHGNLSFCGFDYGGVQHRCTPISIAQK